MIVKNLLLSSFNILHVHFLCAALFDEIKGLKEEKKKEGNFQMQSITGKVPIPPCMEFEYSDSELHGDLHTLIRFSCLEVCSSAEQTAEVIHFWSFFMAQIIGVASELLSVDAARSVLKSRDHDAQEHVNVVNGNGGNALDCGAAVIRGSAEGNNLIDKYNSIGLMHGVVNGTCSDSFHSGKEMHSFSAPCKEPAFNGTGTSELKPVISDVQHSIGADSRVNLEVVSGLLAAQL